LRLNIESSEGSSFIPSAQINVVDLFRLHGTMRVIRVDHRSGWNVSRSPTEHRAGALINNPF